MYTLSSLMAFLNFGMFQSATTAKAPSQQSLSHQACERASERTFLHILLAVIAQLDPIKPPEDDGRSDINLRIRHTTNRHQHLRLSSLKTRKETTHLIPKHILLPLENDVKYRYSLALSSASAHLSGSNLAASSPQTSGSTCVNPFVMLTGVMGGITQSPYTSGSSASRVPRV